MNGVRILAFVMIIAGALGLVYGGFSYTQETHRASVGPIEMSVSENKSINVPVWADVGALVIGGVLLVAGGKGG